jgi:predicted esterase
MVHNKILIAWNRFNEKSLIIILFMSVYLNLAFSSVAYAELDVSCIGSPNAKHNVIYLHGMDYPLVEYKGPQQEYVGTFVSTETEWYNRQTLKALADKYDLRIALPRAKMPCPRLMLDGGICWGGIFNHDQLRNIIPDILETTRKPTLESSKGCFPKDAPFGAIGYSNGGFLLAKWLLSDIYSEFHPAPQWVIAVSSGKIFPRKELKTELQAKPRSLTLVLGKSDIQQHQPGFKACKTLLEYGMDIQCDEFEGGHVFPYNSVAKALEARLRSNPVLNQ